ncbi:shikimate dehydrogenase [Buchnera aphidicola]|uniref:shikimate dehydrogenase n=1 Tax=Buchnera aphidicola TaxID=9 RepID=UPI0009E4078D|nr:shikimate dehydrogenase [Buchnera aphidicola]
MLQKSILEKKIKRVTLFGNPVKQSLSPLIHQYFSKETGVLYQYTLCLCTEENFFLKISNFFKNGGIGANITVPFKKKIFSVPHIINKFSRISKTVNTLIKCSNNKIIGDNTDGLGLLYDLKNLFIFKKNTTVLLLGAGGAATSVIYHLLMENCLIYISNRTLMKSKILIKQFKKFGKIFIFEEYKCSQIFDIIINATSSGLYGSYPIFPLSVLHHDIFCYDISYNKNGNLTPFLKLCKNYGVKNFSDGLGMLVAQAAYSFFAWFKIMPNIQSTIMFIRSLNEKLL